MMHDFELHEFSFPKKRASQGLTVNTISSLSNWAFRFCVSHELMLGYSMLRNSKLMATIAWGYPSSIFLPKRQMLPFLSHHLTEPLSVQYPCEAGISLGIRINVSYCTWMIEFNVFVQHWFLTSHNIQLMSHSQSFTGCKTDGLSCRKSTYNSNFFCKMFWSQIVHLVLDYPMKHILHFLMQWEALELIFFEWGQTFM